MITLIKRLLFVAILLGIGYGIYWLIDKKGANDLKETIVSNTQETVETLKNISKTGDNNLLDEELGDISEIQEIYEEKNIIVTDPKIEAPIEIKPIIKTTSKPKATTTTVKKTTTPNILFQLFQ